MAPPLPKVAYTVAEAAAAAGLDVLDIRRALRATDPGAWPPPLRGKKAGAGDDAQALIPAGALHEWIESLPDWRDSALGVR
jgi:hypothetical protein